MFGITHARSVAMSGSTFERRPVLVRRVSQPNQQHPDLDPEFHEIVDQRTGETLTRDEVTYSTNQHGGLSAD